MAIAMLVEGIIGSRPVVGEERVEKLTELQSKQLDTFNENNKLLITLATALIGAITGFLLHREGNSRVEAGDLRRAVAAWVFAALSLYFGHLTSRQITWMLQAQFFDLFHAAVLWPARAQFWTFFLSAILLADFVYRSVQRNQANAA
jgi:hypothetical protein